MMRAAARFDAASFALTQIESIVITTSIAVISVIHFVLSEEGSKQNRDLFFVAHYA
jgi:hypothetical protein